MIVIQKFSKNREYLIDVLMPSLKFDGVFYDYKYYFVNKNTGEVNKEGLWTGRENIYVLKLNLNFHIKYYKSQTIKNIIQ